ncbi:LysR family transcriptional regulator [Xanthovirga aplysinae]|uniref:LysR family transcriptional regulator n=1 Tax=Xanthovirga aplysinae TaxID=2529853 RepID=UPI0012BCDE1D|nr:LysR family transcriptional regulator [Xanthovirga aplysinae]MTI32530.1 LysR family transcriptional regulator [Xanthovirga aplysinae]
MDLFFLENIEPSEEGSTVTERRYMLDFRLKVFYTVAQTLNFTQASEQLCISQPAVTKQIRELEQQLQVTLFDRSKRQVSLTKEGEVVLKHTHIIFEQYQKLTFDLNSLKNKTTGQLKLGASTTIAQYVIPPLLAKFHHQYPHINIDLINANSKEIEHLLTAKKIHLGLIEGARTNTDLKYIPFMKDEIVLVCSKHNKQCKKGWVSLNELKELPLLVREEGSGTSKIIENFLHQHEQDFSNFNVHMRLGSTESIKNYLLHSETFALLSVFSIRNELAADLLRIVELEDNIDINRMFSFVYRQGQPLPVAELFMRFASSN